MSNAPNSTGKRKTATLRPDHHRILRSRREQTGIKIEALLDEVLELGLKYKRWISEPDTEEATTA